MPAPRFLSSAIQKSESGISGRAVGAVFPQPVCAQARVHVVDVDHSFVGISPPSEGQIGTITLRIARPDVGNFAALAIEFAAELAGDVNYTRAAVVVAHI